MVEDNDKLAKAIEELIIEENSDRIIKHVLSLVMPSKRRFIFLTVAFLFIFSFNLFYVIKQKEPISISVQLFDTVNEMTIPILALAVTGYSIFQALVNGKTLITLLEVDDKEYSKLKKYNNFFFGFSLLFLIIIITSFISKAIFANVNPNWYIPWFSLGFNNVLYSLLMSTYLIIVFHALIEIKSFIYNLYEIFRINAAAKGINYLKNDTK